MNVHQTMFLASANALMSIALIAVYALAFAPAPAPSFAVLDVGEIYRLKENQVAAVLFRREATESERETALKGATAFGQEIAALIRTLPEECRCFVLSRGAVIGPAARLPDLTPEARRRLGL